MSSRARMRWASGWRSRPDQRRAVSGERQDGEGSRWREVFLGPAMMRAFVLDRHHEADLVIGPAHELDARCLARRRVAAIGGHDQRRPDRLARGQRHLRQVRAGSDSPARRCPPQSGCGVLPRLLPAGRHRGSGSRSCGRRAGPSCPPHRMQQHGARAAGIGTVGDDDLGHGLGVMGNLGPDAQRLEHAARRGGDGRGPAVECRAGKAARVLASTTTTSSGRRAVAPPSARAAARPLSAAPTMITSGFESCRS